MAPNDTNANVTERQLALGLWVLAHREALRTVLTATLAVVSAIAWVIVVFGIVRYVVIDGARLDRALAELVTSGSDRGAVVRGKRAAPLTIAAVYLVPSGVHRYDAAAQVVNANSEFLARITYAFDVAGAPAEEREAVVLPGTSRWLAELNLETSARPQRASLTIRAVAWERIGHRVAADVSAFVGDRLRVTVTDAQFLPPRAIAANVARAVFTITNGSAYGLRDLELVVLLRRAGVLVGVTRTTVPALRSGETRTEAATWFHDVGAVQSVEVIPFVNVFDPAHFLAIP